MKKLTLAASLALATISFTNRASADCIPLLAKVQTWQSTSSRNFTAGLLTGSTPRKDNFFRIDAGPMAYTPPKEADFPRPIRIPGMLDTKRLVEMRVSGERPFSMMVRVRMTVEENPRITLTDETGKVWERFTAEGTCPDNMTAQGRSELKYNNWQIKLSYQQRPH